MKIVYPNHLKFLKKLKSELKRDKGIKPRRNRNHTTIDRNECSISKSILNAYSKVCCGQVGEQKR